ncbi:MFS transporter [Lentzea sp. BCCO 10_0798]|uniref:MFS transporter n=1 Tax=Lentzea kristufekii TaxID=3095430 RepID=A0ABU4U6T2_9PSEU|nr:MFS transporter [Lentzea sp. BCCO 10_0798]MDX8056287.1 MFS transporter [Lentzea sp. BCCO 10_0798]
MRARQRFSRDWWLLLVAQAISTTGTQITVVLLPAVAILAFGSGIGPATLLLVAEFLPAALLGPFGGVLIDRARLRSVLVSMDFVRACALLAAAAAIASGVRSVWILYLLAAVLGIASAVFDSAAETAIPHLTQDLDRANATRSGLLNLVRIAGPGLGGLIIAAASAQLALLLNAVTFLASAVVIAAATAPALRAKAQTNSTRPVHRQLSDAIGYLRKDLVLRRSLLGTATLNFAGSGIGALFFVYAYQQLLLRPGQVGLTMSAFSLGAVLGAAGSAWASRRLGTGLACAMCASVAAASLFLIPAASLGRPFEVLLVYQFLFGAAATAWATILLSLRQRRTEPAMLGRVSALINAVTVATVPFGAVAGTVLAEIAGLTPAMLVLAVVAAATPTFYWTKGFRTVEPIK